MFTAPVIYKLKKTLQIWTNLVSQSCFKVSFCYPESLGFGYGKKKQMPQKSKCNWLHLNFHFLKPRWHNLFPYECINRLSCYRWRVKLGYFIYWGSKIALFFPHNQPPPCSGSPHLSNHSLLFTSNNNRTLCSYK